MKSFQFGYTQDWKNSPIAFWVHIETNKEPWYHSESFSPPAPIKHGDLGYPVLTIEFDGFNFIFTSK